MAGWLVVLVVTNCLTIAAIVLMRHRTVHSADGVDEVLYAPRPAGVTTRGRRLITIEVLNPIELVGTRGGWVAGLAGSLAPGIARRVVYDQVLKTLRRELAEQQVVADVRLHELRPAPAAPPTAVVIDEVVQLDLNEQTSGLDPDQL